MWAPYCTKIKSSDIGESVKKPYGQRSIRCLTQVLEEKKATSNSKNRPKILFSYREKNIYGNLQPLLTPLHCIRTVKFISCTGRLGINFSLFLAMPQVKTEFILTNGPNVLFFIIRIPILSPILPTLSSIGREEDS